MRLDPDQSRQNVGPDLIPNCFQRRSADDTMYICIAGKVNANR